ncbi:MAG: PQQ-binding-like beta-propeller repeat protein [Bacteroidales bacterium]|jgi:outer membrane protein assembly factor BamB|nr:PQQ-binding-like beta-propeller repeat protein [Bacteroidales bacterium]
MKEQKNPASTIRLLRQIAFVSILFAAILCILILVNWFQLQRADPLNTPVLKTTIERLSNNPDDQQLRDQLRTLDLLARKAYFTSQWQICTGGYLLLISILVVVICLKTIDFIQKKIPDLPGAKTDTFWIDRKINRKWVAFTGIGIVLISLVLAFFTHDELGKMLGEENSRQTDTITDQGLTKNGPSSRQNNVSRNSDLLTPVTTGDTNTKPGLQALNDFPTWAEIIENYPSFRGPGGNGVVYQKNIPTNWDGKTGKNIKWKTTVPLPGYNSPVVWNDRVFLSGANETKREVYSFDASTGKILWAARVDKIPGSPEKAPAVNKETGQAAPTLTTDGRRVYAIFANGDLVAFDFDGKLIWARNLGLPANHYGYSSSLMMYRDLLIVQYDQRGSAFVVGLSGKTGETVWKTSRNVKVSWASPVVIHTGKRTELLLAAEPFVAAYNPANGKEFWKLDCISGEVGPSVAYADGIVFSVNDYSKLAAVQIGETPKLLWENSDYLSDVPSPVASDKYVFLLTSYGTAVCYDAKTGAKYWEHDFENTTYASPVLADGKIYAMDKQGIMHIFKADKEFSLVSEPKLGEGSVCTPAMVNGKIFIRGDKNLYCVGK